MPFMLNISINVFLKFSYINYKYPQFEEILLLTGNCEVATILEKG